MPEISVIVPVYNTEQYLSRCIESILKQSFTDFELLLVDDGSTDGSGAVCDAYAEKDERIRVFHKENGGVSSARNRGIDEAYGGFLTFVDSDDLINETCLEHLMSMKSDLVVAGIKHVKGNCADFKVPKQAKFISMMDLPMHWNTPEMNYLYCYPVAKRFRKDIIKRKNIRFDENLFYQEDLCFILSYMMNVDGFDELPYADYEYWMMDAYRAGKYKMNALQLTVHHDVLEELFDQLELKCKGGFSFVKDNVNLRLLRSFYAFLQDCSNVADYRRNMRVFHKQRWAMQLLSLLKGKKEKRVLYGGYYCPVLSYLVEKRFAH